jgi:hypothetical protein
MPSSPQVESATGKHPFKLFLCLEEVFSGIGACLLACCLVCCVSCLVLHATLILVSSLAH